MKPVMTSQREMEQDLVHNKEVVLEDFPQSFVSWTNERKRQCYRAEEVKMSYNGTQDEEGRRGSH